MYDRSVRGSSEQFAVLMERQSLAALTKPFSERNRDCDWSIK